MPTTNGFTYTIVGANCTITDYDPTTSSFGYDVAIPNTLDGFNVTIIGLSAFEAKELNSLTIPSSVESIGIGAFRDNNLSALVIPSSVTSIGASAFSYNSIASISLDHAMSLGFATFGNNTGIEVTLNANVTNPLGGGVFDSSNIGVGLTITSNVTAIPNAIFANCGLTSLTIGSNVTSIGNNAFEYNSLASLTIPNSVTSIGLSVFKDNSLTSLTIGSGVTSISNDAFKNNSIAEVIISQAMSLGSNVFQNNVGINVTLDANVTTTSPTVGVFTNCSIGVGLTITDNVTTIPNALFRDCGLTSLTIPSSVIATGNYAFADNTNLTSLTILSSAFTIGTGTFDNIGTGLSSTPEITKYGIASASSQRSSSYSADLAFNQNYGDDWQSTSANKVNCWLQYHFARPYIVTSYAITGGISNQAPKAWTFEGYVPATATWVTLDTQTGQTFDATIKQRRTYDIANITKYSVYRLFITEQNGGTYTSIFEIELDAIDDKESIVAGATLQTEIETTNPISSLTGMCLQAEFDTGTLIAQVCGVCLQVEILEPDPPDPDPPDPDPPDPVIPVYPELRLPRFKPVELVNSNEQHLTDGVRELNRQLDWMFKSLTEAIIRRKQLKNKKEGD